jgi:hypothetical protein
VFCWDGERAPGRVMRGLKIQIWDSECRDRSAKRMVYDSGIGEVLGGNVAAKTHCREGRL